MKLMTLVEFFNEGYFYFSINLIGFILVFLMFIATLVKTKKVSLLQIMIATVIFCIATFRPVCSFIFSYEPVLKFNGKEVDFDLYSTVLCYILLFLSHIVYYLETLDTFSHKLLYRLAPENLGRKVFAYYDKSGRVISYTEAFFDELSIPLRKNYKWHKEITSIEVNGTKYNYEDFTKYLREIGDISFKLTLVVDVEEISFYMQKTTIESESYTIGFILTSNEVVNNSTSLDGFYNIVDSISIPFAYYNDDVYGVCFKLNSAMSKLLGIKGDLLTYDELEKHVFADDLIIFYQSVNNNLTSNIYKYRVMTNEGLKMFEEIKVINEESCVISITASLNYQNESFYDKKYLTSFVDSLIEENKEFGSLFIALNSINAFTNELGLDITKELVRKYLQVISKELLKNDTICKISDMEYIVVVNDIERFDSIVLDITKNLSKLLTSSIMYNSINYEFNNKIGICYKDETITNASSLLKALEEAISYTNKEGYEKNYSIHSKPITPFVEEVVEEKEYSFEDYKLNLDNSFLNDED